MMKAVYFLLVHLWLTSIAISDKPDPDKDIVDVPAESRDSGKDESTVYNPPFDSSDPPEPLRSPSGARLVTINELAAHGINGSLRPLWLAIAGRVYDVDKGKSYGSEGGYSFFTGRDGSKAFVTGNFTEEGLTDDISDLTPTQVSEIQNWVEFYNKDYTFVGKLIGRYFDKTGNPTKHWYRYQKKLKQAEVIKADEMAEKRLYPPCNSRFAQNEGSSVSCSTKSGGIERDWEGLPRRYFPPGGKKSRCACIKETDLDNPHVQLFPGCGPTDKVCKLENKPKDEL